MVNKKNIFSAPYKTSRDWLYTPSTYLLDSYTPSVEEIFLPRTETKPCKLMLTYSEKGKASYQSQTFFGKIKSRLFTDSIRFSKGVLIDLRDYSPQNLAHAVMIHLPIALMAKDFLKDLGKGSPILVLPDSLPKYIEVMFEELGFDLLLTNDAVVGEVCDYDIDVLVGMRGLIPSILKSSLEETKFSKKIFKISEGMPKKIFLSRKDSRCLKNELEVELFLKEKGYQKVYMEDYSVLEQLSMVSLADSIVAVHGAALGVLVLRHIFTVKPVEFIELFSPAHMTNVYRIVTHQIGGKWVGVRGKLWPALIDIAYSRNAKNIHEGAFLDFEICLLSLERALLKVSE